jgi:AcrR family transcriptional regulator
MTQRHPRAKNGILMSQNASLEDNEGPSLEPSERRPLGEAVVAKTARRALAKREETYTDEVRRLIDAGMAVIVQSGTTASPRVADIVRAAGLSNDAFYRHFASKEELVSAIVEAGAERLAGYLAHQMTKGVDPADQLRRWIEGIMSQASDPVVAEQTRAVLWNGSRIGDHARRSTDMAYEPLTALIHQQLLALGSTDPARDSAAIGQAVMGRMEDFLWQRTSPESADVEHLVRFCLGAVAGRGSR